MASTKFVLQSFSIWILLVTVNLCYATTPTTPFSGNIRLCGSELADALDIVCNSNFNVESSKRSGGISNAARQSLAVAQHSDTRSYSLLSSKFFHFKSDQRRRFPESVKKRGISSECCQPAGGCSIQTLMSYCQQPRERLHDLSLLTVLQQQNEPLNHNGIITTTTQNPTVSPSTNRPAVFQSNHRKFNYFFFLEPLGNPTRNPLQ